MDNNYTNFPEPTINKNGWPWIMPSNLDRVLNNKNYPKISIITPSFNQGEFIEETIRSIVLQNYPNLEYIIVDGGSTDNTLSVIKKYEKWIDIIISEPDAGQSDAINKGWKLATGEVTTWINSDDYLSENTLFNVANIAHNYGCDNIIIGNVINFYTDNNTQKLIKQYNINLNSVLRFWDRRSNWHQPGMFFPMKKIIKTNYLDISFHYSMDFDLICKLLLDTKVIYAKDVFTYFRLHDNSKGVEFPEKTILEKFHISSIYWNHSYNRFTAKDFIKSWHWFIKLSLKLFLNKRLKNISYLYLALTKFKKNIK